MLAVLLTILKIILIIILVVICLIFVLLSIVLFVGIPYKIEGEKAEDLIFTADISWLAKIFRIKIQYHKGLQYKVKIFWKTINYSNKKETKKEFRKINKATKKMAAKTIEIAKETVVNKDGEMSKNSIEELNASDTGDKNEDSQGDQEGKRIEKSKENLGNNKEYQDSNKDSKDGNIKDIKIKDNEKHGDYADNGNVSSNDNNDSNDRNDSKNSNNSNIINEGSDENSIKKDKKDKKNKKIKKKNSDNKKESKFAAVKEQLQKIQRILKNEESKGVIRFVFRNVWKIIHAILPKKVRLSLDLGFDDPAVTGYVIGGISIFYAVLGDSMKLNPHFEEKILQGKFYLKGRIFICVIAFYAIKILLDKRVRKLIKEFK